MRQFFHAATIVYLGAGSGFTLGDTQYPPNWLELASADEIAALGLIEVVTVGERRDDRYFDNAETLKDGVLMITSVSKDLSVIKALKWAEIKGERDRLRFDGGVQVDGHWFLSNQTATVEYNSIINLGLPDATVIRPNWRTIDGAEVPMSPGLAKQIIAAGIAQAAALDDAAQAHKAAMEKSSDPSAYDFSTGWPASRLLIGHPEIIEFL